MTNGKHTETLVTTAAQREAALARPAPKKSEEEEIVNDYLISMNSGWDDDDDDSSTIDWKAWTSLTDAEQDVYMKRIKEYTAWVNKKMRQQQEERRRLMRDAMRPRELLIAKFEERAAKRLRHI